MKRKHRLLLIDDSREILETLEAFLKRKYEITTAGNGFDGLEILEQNENSIDLVITDLMMPELNGVGVISILKKKYPGMPVIAITGWRGQIEASGNKIEADRLLEKPFDFGILDRTISELLAAKSNRSPETREQENKKP